MNKTLAKLYTIDIKSKGKRKQIYDLLTNRGGTITP